MQLKQKLMSQCCILSEHCVLTSSSIRFFKVIHLTICSHKYKVRDHHRILIHTTLHRLSFFVSSMKLIICWLTWNKMTFNPNTNTHREWVITFLNKIRINKNISKIHYTIIYNITQLNSIHVTSPLSFKIRISITNYITHESYTQVKT